MKPTAQLLRQSDKGFHRVNKSLSYNGAAAERPLLQQHRRHPFPPQPRHQRVLQGSPRDSRSSLRKGKELGLFSSNLIISYEYTNRRSSIHKYINAKHVEKNRKRRQRRKKNKKKIPSQQLTKDLWYRNVLQVRINQNGVSQSKFTKRNRNK